MKTILLDFLNFIRNPKDEQFLAKDKKYKWKVFFIIFLINIIFTTLYLLVLQLSNYEDHYSHDIQNQNYNIIKAFLLMVIGIPFIEEVIFRWILRRNKWAKKIISDSVWNKLFPYLFYFLAIGFAIIHIFNYSFEKTGMLLLLSPLLVLSQFFGALGISYLRVKFTFWLGFTSHAFWNFILIFIVSAADFWSSKQPDLIINNQNYTLKVQEKLFLDINNPSIISFDSSSDSIYFLELKNNDFEVAQKFIAPNTNYQSNYIMDIEFKSEKGIPITDFLKILEEKGFIYK